MAAAIQLHDYVEAISNDHLAWSDALLLGCLRSGRCRTAAAATATGRCDRGRGSAVLRSRTLVRGKSASPRLGRRPLAHPSSRSRLGARDLSTQVARGMRECAMQPRPQRFA